MRDSKGFTLMELMVTLAIVIVLSTLAYINIESRLQISRLESAASTLASDLSYARSSALLKGCPVRFVFCNDKRCTNSTVSKISGSSGNYIGASSQPAQYYALLRMSQKVSSGSGSLCYNPNAVNVTDTPGDNWNYWDFDRRPQAIPRGIVVSAIYSASGIPDYSDWSDTASAAAGNSLWFNSIPEAMHSPITALNALTGDDIAFQLSLKDCNPGDPSADCVGYFVVVSSGGVTSLVKCQAGPRSDNTNICYR